RVAEEMASPGTQSLPDFAASSPSPDEPEAGVKPTGWDPIRVSTAWPALAHTPMIAGPVRAADVPGGAGASWEATALAAGPPPQAGSGPAGSGPAGSGAAGFHVAGTSAGGGKAGTGRRTANGTPASASSEGAVSRDRAVRSPRTAIMAVAVLLLCALAILLAVFA
ncbi:MAG: hypothetical protein ACRDNW_26405, partial [Trebonia sp.]